VINHLADAVALIANVQNELDSASLVAFMEFERKFAPIVEALSHWLGTRQKAARWMMVHRVAFDGRSAFELVLEGDIERLWKAMPYV
jgi:hypothetical protein